MSKPNYIAGNAKKIKQLFKKRKFSKPQLIITSPPYFDVLNYENNGNQIGHGQTYDGYLLDIINVFQDCYELSTSNATFWLIVDTFRRNGELKTLPFDINNKLKGTFKKTWTLKEILVWDKEKNIPWNGKGKFKNEFEYILFFSKKDKLKFNIDRVREINDLKKWWLSYPERYNPCGKAPSNIWRFTTPIRGWGNSYQNHLCPFPFPLVEKIISIATDENDLILDPFAGSGSVLAMASVMKRRSIGIDINKNYKKLFKDEVLIGARKYWEKREKELSYNKKSIVNFKTTNQKLRKLKVASNISSHINSINSHQFLYFLIDEKNSDKPDLYVIENSITPKIDLENEKINNLIKQAKVKPNLIIIDENKLKDKFKNLKLYKYKLDKFYSYNSESNLLNIMANYSRYDFIYSNIDIKIL
jgi:DNA modification methylase